MSAPPVTIPDSEVHPVHARAVDDDFELWVANPQQGFVPAQGRPRVLYVLDANLVFGTVVEMTRLMHKLYGELPPLLVVGIAYPTRDGFRQGLIRTRDFTPSADAGFGAMSASLPRPETVEPVEPPMGGADAFLRFVEEQVVPFVRERFDVDEEGSTLFGSSMGGLLAVHALLRTPHLFDNILAVSPALWWNEGATLRAEPAAHDQILRPRAYLAAGGLEEAAHVPMLARFRLISNARAMARRLVDLGWATERATFEEIPGETHTSVIPAALTRGLRVLHTPGPSAPESRET